MLYHKYTELIGELLTTEVNQVLSKEVILLDEDRNELFLPKSEQIPKDFFKKGDSVKAVVKRIDMQKGMPKVILLE